MDGTVKGLDQTRLASSSRPEQKNVEVVPHIVVVISLSRPRRQNLVVPDGLANVCDLLPHDLHHHGGHRHAAGSLTLVFVQGRRDLAWVHQARSVRNLWRGVDLQI